MRARTVLLALAGLLTGTDAALAQTKLLDELQRCAAVAEAADRLGCYDRFADEVRQIVERMQGGSEGEVEAAEPAADAVDTSVVDLNLDMDKMIGIKIRVRGRMVVWPDWVLLNDENSNANAVRVYISELPRPQQRAVVGGCGRLNACTGVVIGTIRKVDHSVGIVAESVQLDPTVIR